MTNNPIKPVLYMDFDGVINFFSPQKFYASHSGYASTPKKGTAHGYSINWNPELVDRLRDLDASWEWLSTWRELCTTELDPLLEIVSDTSHMWKDYRTDFWQEGKYEWLRQDQEANPRPFVWVDDVATMAYRPEHFPNTPHLIVTPSDMIGISNVELQRIEKFVEEN